MFRLPALGTLQRSNRELPHDVPLKHAWEIRNTSLQAWRSRLKSSCRVLNESLITGRN